MFSKTNLLYILGFLISLSILSIFGFFSEPRTIDNSNELFIFICSILTIAFPNWILIFKEKIYDSAIKGDTQKIISFINKGGNLNQKNSQGFTFIHYAIMSRQIKMLNLLIEKRADINIKSKKGNTPLHLATYYGYFDLVKLLLKNGACVNLRNQKNQTPLQLLRDNYFSTISQKTKSDLINLLEDYGAK